jgi:hypothetical protein
VERLRLGAFESNNFLRHFFTPLPRWVQRLLLPLPRRLPPR